MRVKTQRNILFGLVIAALAVLWVLRALGLFPPYLNDLIVRATPIALVVAGLSLLLRGRVPGSEVIAFILSVALLGGVGYTAFNVRQAQERDENQLTVEETLDESLVLLRVRLQSLATDVEITRAPAGEDRTIRVSYAGSTERDLAQSFIEDDETSATLTVNEIRLNPVDMLEAVGRGTMLVELPAEVPVDLQLEAVDGEERLNLGGVLLERLNLNQTSGEVFLNLPAYSPVFSRPEDTLGTLALASGPMTIRVPEAVAARFDMSESTGGEPNYDPAEYNLLFSRDILEARDIDVAEIVQRYNLVVSRGQLVVTVPGDDGADS